MAKKKVKKSQNNGKSQKSLYLEDTLWERMENSAEAEGRSLNNFLENFLKKSFAA